MATQTPDNSSPLLCSGDGYGRGEGFAAIVLRQQQLECEAEAFAMISGSAVNQDGRSSGLTAPNGPSQTALVRCGLLYTVGDMCPLSYHQQHLEALCLHSPVGQWHSERNVALLPKWCNLHMATSPPMVTREPRSPSETRAAERQRRRQASPQTVSAQCPSTAPEPRWATPLRLGRLARP